MVGIFPQDDRTDVPAPAETTQVGVQTMAVPTDAAGTSSTPPLVYSVLSRPWGMPPSMKLISQAAWTEVVT